MRNVLWLSIVANDLSRCQMSSHFVLSLSLSCISFGCSHVLSLFSCISYLVLSLNKCDPVCRTLDAKLLDVFGQ